MRKLIEFKKEVEKFYKVIKTVADFWGFSQYKVITVLVQNLQFDSSNCHGYEFKEDLEKTKELVKIITTVCNYTDSHFENWVKKEIDCLYTAYIMTEEN